MVALTTLEDIVRSLECTTQWTSLYIDDGGSVTIQIRSVDIVFGITTGYAKSNVALADLDANCAWFVPGVGMEEAVV